MRGKQTFSRREADKIRELLVRIGNTPDRPHTLNRLRTPSRRKYAFYISDFDVDTGGKRFTETEFDALLATGTITVLDLYFNDQPCNPNAGPWNEEARRPYKAILR